MTWFFTKGSSTLSGIMRPRFVSGSRVGAAPSEACDDAAFACVTAAR